MKKIRDIDPAETAVAVAELLMKRDGITQNEALASFMSSDTFSRLVSDAGMSSLDPKALLEMFDREVNNG